MSQCNNFLFCNSYFDDWLYFIMQLIMWLKKTRNTIFNQAWKYPCLKSFDLICHQSSKQYSTIKWSGFHAYQLKAKSVFVHMEQRCKTFLVYRLSQGPESNIKGYYHLRQLSDIGSICNKCIIGASYSSRISTCQENGSPLLPSLKKKRDHACSQLCPL